MKFFKPKFWDKNKISFFSILLFPFALLVILGNFIRKKVTKTEQSKIPIICVGNIYLGGTGKTPLCIEIFSILKQLNRKPAFVRKKYKSFNDEIELEKRIGPVYQGSKRIDAISEAIQNNSDIVILDDGYQDFSIKKNLSIVCFNEKQWIGNGFSIPSGPLRENIKSLDRANCVVINGNKNHHIERQILEKNKLLKIFYANYKAQNINEFKNKRTVCFAGIGNPVNFFDLLAKNNVNIVEQISFPDHYNYSEKDLKILKEKARTTGSVLLTTEKDYLRIKKYNRENIKFLKIKIEIENKNNFIEEIKKII